MSIVLGAIISYAMIWAISGSIHSEVSISKAILMPFVFSGILIWLGISLLRYSSSAK